MVQGITSIIVPVYNIDDEVKSHFYECIRRIKLYSNNYQLIVIQNGGPRLDCEADIFIYKDKPIGFAKALNIGLSLADGEFISLVSADIYLPENWMTMLDDVDGVLCPQDKESEHIVWDDSAWGAMWITTKDNFRKVGYHDEMLNQRYSDQDWWIRFKKAGLKIQRTGKVIVKHFEGSTVNKMPEVSLWKSEEEFIKQKHGYSLFSDYKRSL